MKHWVHWLATLLAFGAALLIGMIGAWQSLSLLTLGLRSLVAGVLVFAFVRAGGDLAGRALLRGLAEHEVKEEESKKRSATEDDSERLAA